MPDGDSNGANHREVIRQIESLRREQETTARTQSEKLERLDKAIHSTETPYGLRVEVRDIRRTLEGHAREKGLTERVEVLEHEINTKLGKIEGEVEGVRDALSNLKTTGAVRDAKQEGVKIGRGALIAGGITLLGVLATLSAIVSTWLARYAPPG